MANTAPLSGMRDFLPVDVRKRAYVIATIEEVYQSYGFEPLLTPALERLDTLLGKYGDEGDQLIFRVLKRGEELQRALGETEHLGDSLSDAGLRYDLTVPLARVVAEYRHTLPSIFKRYQIQPVYRAERPARGRFREFYQCDVDIVGSTSPVVEAEVIGAAAEVLRRLGFQGEAEQFTIRLNHRGVLNGLLEVAGVDPALGSATLVAIDKLDKIGLEGVRQELERGPLPPRRTPATTDDAEIVEEGQRGLPAQTAAALLDMMRQGLEMGGAAAAVLDWLEDVLAPSATGRESVANLRSIVACIAAGPAAEHVRIDPFVARGLSYYTGAIFEIAFPGLSSSGGGGGRYDNLIGMFGKQSIPACGFSLGLERLILLMEERGMFPARLAGEPHVLLTLFNQDTVPATMAMAMRLRAEGLHVDVYPDVTNYGKQFKYAAQRRIRYALLLSPREIAAGIVAVKDLVSGDQEDVPDDAIIAWLSRHIQA